MTNVFEVGCQRHEIERKNPGMVEEIADCLLEDHMALMTENAAMRQKLDIMSYLLRKASGRMSYGIWSSDFRTAVKKALEGMK